MQLDISLALAGISAFIAILALIWAGVSASRLSKLSAKMAVFLSGEEGKSLETVILGHSEQLRHMDKEIQDLFEISNKIHGLAKRGIHKVGVVRFNPFKDIGGDQSFALALLDGRHDGLVVSSLHTREGTRVYAKPIAKGESPQYTLTDEEKEALRLAAIVKPTGKI